MRPLPPALNLLALPLLWLVDLFASWDRQSHPVGLSVEAVPLLAAIAYVPLVWRNRWPPAALGLTAFGTVVLAVVVPGFVPMMGVWLGLYTVGRLCPRRTAFLGLGLAFVPVTVNVFSEVARSEPKSRFGAFLVASLIGTMVNLAVFAVGRWVRWSVEQRLLAARYAAAEASAAERARIARELHDVVAHSVSLMVIQAAGAAHVMRRDPDRAQKALRHVDDLGQRAIAELQQMLRLLDPADGEGTGNEPPAQALRLGNASTLVENLRSAGFETEFVVEGSPRPLTPDVDAAAYRIAQEALTNVAKYADPRLPVRVEVLWNATGVHINVANKGAMRPGTRGSTGSTGHGVPGMRERARAVGGSLEAGQTHDGGYSVRATFPVPA